MHYEINVAKDGQHLFATHERSLQTEKKTKDVYDRLAKAFPESEGFSISVTRWDTIGKSIDPEKIK